jgi:hypothetical protein
VRTTHPVARFCAEVPSAGAPGFVVTVRGVAGSTVRAALGDTEMTVDGTYTRICTGNDQAALYGLLHRLQELGLEVVEVFRAPSGPVAR